MNHELFQQLVEDSTLLDAKAEAYIDKEKIKRQCPEAFITFNGDELLSYEEWQDPDA